MPYSVPLTHVRIEGVIGATAAAPVEVWSFGFHVSGALLPAGYDAALPAVWDAAAAYITNTAAEAGFSPEVWLTEVMAGSLDADGTLSTGFYSRYAEAAVKGTGAGNIPLQLTTAVTLDAGKPAAGRFNRFYPPPQPMVTTLGQITQVVANARAIAARTLVNACVDALEDQQGTEAFNGVVASSRYQSNRLIQNVRVGRVPDVQRRRRNGLSEAYQSVAY